MKDDNKTGGFEGLEDMFLPKGNRSMNGPNDDENNLVTPEEIEKQMKSFDNKKDEPTKKVPKTDDSKKSNKPVDEEIDDEEEEEDDTSSDDEDVDDVEDSSTDDTANNLEDKKKNKKDAKVPEVDIEEEELVDAFADLFADELGWKFDDGEKPKDIKGIVKYMQDIIEANSEPRYASDEIKELDDFVKNGGNVKNFLKSVYSEDIDTDKIDITKEFNQKAVIRKNLRDKGYSEVRIEKLVNRYEETGSLEDEAADSLSEIKETEEKTKAKLLETQKKQADQQVKEQLNFVQSVEKTIKNSADIRGLALSDKDKTALLEYIFKPEKDGMTKYQKDYNSDIKHLVESAYFTMKRDTFVNQVQKKATTNAVKNLKLKIKSKGKSTSNTESDMDDNSRKIQSIWDIAGSQLLK